MCETLKELQDRLNHWMEKTDDPILQGSLPIPLDSIALNPEDKDLIDHGNYLYNTLKSWENRIQLDNR